MDFAMYASQIKQEFEKIEGTSSVSIRCSVPQDALAEFSLEKIKEGVSDVFLNTEFSVVEVTPAPDSLDKGSQDIFIKVIKA